ncbi:MAG: InlB B-repeat-containing protein [Lachnospiraceae bacterium]|nr:InlB B-repeat-containing protein [Lachnospiraceae bacterium]
MKKTVNRILAGVIAFTMIMTGNAFSATVFASENEAAPEAEAYVEETVTEEAPAAEEAFPDEEMLYADYADVEEPEAALTEPENETIGNTGYLHVRYVAEEDGVTGLPTDDTEYEYGDSVTVSMQEPSLDGFLFMGWSPTGDPDMQYTGGYTFTITEDLTLTAIWETADEPAETEEENENTDAPEDSENSDDAENAQDNENAESAEDEGTVERLTITDEDQKIINAVDNYVNSLGGKFPYSYKGKSIQCCAFTDYVWNNIYGKSWRDDTTGTMCVRYNSASALANGQIAEFLSENGAKPGDILWCHDPNTLPPGQKNFNITHFMIILGYDSEHITISDGYGKNGEGKVWANHKTVKYTDSPRNKYFNGSCHVRLYHAANAPLVGDPSYVPGPGPAPTPTPTPVPGEFIGKCGDNLTWKLKKRNAGYGYDLTISGTGPMYDYEYASDTPWYKTNYVAKSLTIGSGVTTIGDYAFSYGIETDGQQLVLPDTVTKIGAHAFDGAKIEGKKIESEEYENALDLSHVTELGEGAFRNTGFTKVTLGEELKEIPDQCFEGCSMLKGEISIPEGVTRIGERAFSLHYSSCHKYSDEEETPEWTVKLPSGLKEIGRDAFRDNIYLTAVTNLLPDGTERVGEYAFDGCCNMEGTLTLPAGVAVEIATFRKCGSLTGELKIPGDLWDGTYMEYSYSGGKLYGHPAPNRIEHHRNIPKCCFAGCKGFTSLKISEGILQIDPAAFYNCTGLSGTLALPKRICVYTEAFKNCSGLTGLTLPNERDSVIDTLDTEPQVKLHGAVFDGCSSLSGDLTLHSDRVSIYDATRMFFDTGLKNIYMEGEWSYEFDVEGYSSYLKKNGSRGTYYSYISDGTAESWENQCEDHLQTFPGDVTIHYDDGPYTRWGKTNLIATQRSRLDAFGYDYDLYSEMQPPQESKPLYIVDAFSWDVVIAMGENGTHNMTPYAPQYPEPEELNRITITVEDESIATIEPNGSGGYKYIPKKVGSTNYTVSIDTREHGVQTAYGSIRVLPNEAAARKAVTGIGLDYSRNELEKGESFAIKAYIYPENASNKAVTWESSDLSVATVNAKGVVTGVGKGETVITATTKDGGFKAMCTVVVNAHGYHVKFNGNGAEGGEMAPLWCDYYKKYTLPKNMFKKAGWTFDGWYSSNAEEDDGTGFRLADQEAVMNLVPEPEEGDETDYEITLYAQWRPEKSYAIVYDGNSKQAYGAEVRGQVPGISGLVYDDEVILQDNRFTAAGCTFAGWNTKADGKGKMITVQMLAEDQPFSIKDDLGVAELPKAGVGNITLYAQWTPNSYTVSFDKNDTGLGESAFATRTFGNTQLAEGETSADFTFGTAIGKLPTLSMEGYAFLGWCTDSSCTSMVKSIPKDQASDLTLYAKWTPWKYTVSYDPNKTQGGEKLAVSGSTAKSTAYYGYPLQISTSKFVNKGYKLQGWSTTQGAEEPDEKLTAAAVADGSVDWADVAAMDNLVINKNGAAVKLYAVWEPVAFYSISYVIEDALKAESETNIYEEQYEYGKGLDHALPTPVRDGYQFAGWFEDTTFKKQVKKVDKNTFGDLVLYPKWSAAYQVVLHSNGENDKTLSGFTYNKEKALPACPFKKADAAFMGWALSETGNVIYSDKAKLKDPVLTETGNPFKLDLYAVWRSDFTYTLHLNGGTYPAKERNQIADGEHGYSYTEVSKSAITLPKTVVKDGYKFNGLIDTATGKKITKIAKTGCRDYVIEADFTPLTYQITYNANRPKGIKGGGRMAAQKLTVGNPAELHANNFFANGYTFIGWSTDPKSDVPELTDGAAFDFGAAGYKSKVTLYAVWIAEQQ